MTLLSQIAGRRPWLTALLLAGAAAAAQATGTSGRGAEAPFLAENDAAMMRMMQGMTVKPSGDVDDDFAAVMIPHHQGAIDMAQAELRHGRNEQLRRIAQEIIIEQGQEIAAMYLAVGRPLPASVASPTQPQPAGSGTGGDHSLSLAHGATATTAEPTP